MFVITDVKIEKHESDDIVFYYKDADYPSLRLFTERDICYPYSSSIEYEVIKGEKFIDYRTGKSVVIGMTKEVERIIGLPMTVFQALSDNLDREREEVERYYKDKVVAEQRIERLKKEFKENTFWKREWRIFKEYLSGKHLEGFI